MDIIKTFLEGGQNSEKLYFKVDKDHIRKESSGSGSGSHNGQTALKSVVESLEDLSSRLGLSSSGNELLG